MTGMDCTTGEIYLQLAGQLIRYFGYYKDRVFSINTGECDNVIYAFLTNDYMESFFNEYNIGSKIGIVNTN